MNNSPVKNWQADAAERLHQSLKKTQEQLGLTRIRMGAILCLVEENGVWRGKTSSSTFRGYLKEEGIEPQAASQYMAVARVFVHKLRLDQADLNRLAVASMRVLLAASKVVNESNKAAVLDIIQNLPRTEAMASLSTLDPNIVPDALDVRNPVTRTVRNILDQVEDLTFDERSMLYRRLGITAQASSTHAPERDSSQSNPRRPVP